MRCIGKIWWWDLVYMIYGNWSQRDVVISSLTWGAPVQQTMRQHEADMLKWHWHENGLPRVGFEPTTSPLYVECSTNLAISSGTFSSTRKCDSTTDLSRFEVYRYDLVARLGIYKQRVLMHRHQGWNVRHGLCHIYMRYLYIYELFIAFVCFVVCSLL